MIKLSSYYDVCVGGQCSVAVIDGIDCMKIALVNSALIHPLELNLICIALICLILGR